MTEAELLIPHCEEYTQELFERAKMGHDGKSQAIEVTNENILRDVKNLIAIRM